MARACTAFIKVRITALRFSLRLYEPLPPWPLCPHCLSDSVRTCDVHIHLASLIRPFMLYEYIEYLRCATVPRDVVSAAADSTAEKPTLAHVYDSLGQTYSVQRTGYTACAPPPFTADRGAKCTSWIRSVASPAAFRAAAAAAALLPAHAFRAFSIRSECRSVSVHVRGLATKAPNGRLGLHPVIQTCSARPHLQAVAQTLTVWRGTVTPAGPARQDWLPAAEPRTQLVLLRPREVPLSERQDVGDGQVSDGDSEQERIRPGSITSCLHRLEGCSTPGRTAGWWDRVKLICRAFHCLVFEGLCKLELDDGHLGDFACCVADTVADASEALCTDATIAALAEAVAELTVMFASAGRRAALEAEVTHRPGLALRLCHRL